MRGYLPKSMIEKLHKPTMPHSFMVTKMNEKINALIDASNRQEEAIRYLAECIYEGSWQKIQSEVNSILEGKETNV